MLDFRREAENLETFARHMDAHPRIHVPQPVWDYSSARVLTMDRIAGEKATRISELRAAFRLRAAFSAIASRGRKRIAIRFETRLFA